VLDFEKRAALDVIVDGLTKRLREIKAGQNEIDYVLNRVLDEACPKSDRETVLLGVLYNQPVIVDSPLPTIQEAARTLAENIEAKRQLDQILEATNGR